MWLTNEDGNHSNLEAAMAVKQARKLIEEKRRPQGFRDLGAWIRELTGVGWALPEGWVSLGGSPCGLGFCQITLESVLGLNIAGGEDVLSEKLWYNEAFRS